MNNSDGLHSQFCAIYTPAGACDCRGYNPTTGDPTTPTLDSGNQSSGEQQEGLLLLPRATVGRLVEELADSISKGYRPNLIDLAEAENLLRSPGIHSLQQQEGFVAGVEAAAKIICEYCATPDKWKAAIPDTYPGAGKDCLEHLPVSGHDEGRGCKAFRIRKLIPAGSDPCDKHDAPQSIESLARLAAEKIADYLELALDDIGIDQYQRNQIAAIITDTFTSRLPANGEGE